MAIMRMTAPRSCYPIGWADIISSFPESEGSVNNHNLNLPAAMPDIDRHIPGFADQ
jgi:hypothetical protein